MKVESIFKYFNSINADLFFCMVLFFASLKYVYGIRKIFDIVMYDESSYLFSGYHLLEKGFPDGQQAPLYAVWYFILSQFQPNKIELFYLNFQVLAIVTPIIFYLLLRRYKLHIMASIIISFLFMISFSNLPLSPKVSNFALLVILMFFILATYAKKIFSYIGIVSFGSLLASFIRPELFIAYLLLIFVYVSLIFIKTKEFKISDLMFFVVFLILSFFLLWGIGLPLKGGRENAAIIQHFAVNWVEWSGSELSGWTDSIEIFKQNFGDSDSFLSMLKNNPFMLFKHLGSNILKVPYNAFGLLFVHSTIFFPRDFFILESVLLILLIIIYIFIKRKKIKYNIFKKINSQKRLLVSAIIYLFPVCLALLLIYPRFHYLVLSNTLVVIVISVLCVSNQIKDKLNKQLLFVGIILIAISPNAIDAFAYKKSIGKRLGDLSNVKTINFISSLNISKEVNILEAEGGYHYYLEENFKRVAEYYKNNQSFNTFRQEYNISMIVLTEKLMNDSRLKNDVEWKYFLENYEKIGFKMVDIPETKRKLIFHEDLLL